ncbi:hypothetical protein MSAN_02269300 [Mycena sanguinolenta]|uniref:Uncharacterized protein n=1 Tax=Mycena sanguinolenta TaxID=230812 RepID=A0A8H6XAF7_9AGAR|nr:hypothetical protein MSAN_02269300 [Mycena sanguinolenta]
MRTARGIFVLGPGACPRVSGRMGRGGDMKGGREWLDGLREREQGRLAHADDAYSIHRPRDSRYVILPPWFLKFDEKCKRGNLEESYPTLAPSVGSTRGSCTRGSLFAPVAKDARPIRARGSCHTNMQRRLYALRRAGWQAGRRRLS